MTTNTPTTTCCDGTGWTGNPYERCIDHYETCGDLLALTHVLDPEETA